MRRETSNSPTREQLVDEFGELDRQIAALKPKLDRYESLKKEIRGWYQDHAADQPAIASGAVYEIQVSARGRERSLSLKAKLTVFAKLKKARFVELASITLTAIERAPELGEEFLAKICEWKQTGARTLIVVAKRPAAA